jgi:hypothetical protein
MNEEGCDCPECVYYGVETKEDKGFRVYYAIRHEWCDTLPSKWFCTPACITRYDALVGDWEDL